MTKATGPAPRPRLLLFLASADHPHRDAACATLAWFAEATGQLFECYYDSEHGGIHFGGGHPAWYDRRDLMGPLPTGGRHPESLHLLLSRFDCRAASLGPALFDSLLADAGVPVLSRSGDIVTFYRDVFASHRDQWPHTLAVIGDGGRPQGIPLSAYAFPEIVNRRLLAVADGDAEAVAALRSDVALEGLWLSPERREAWSRDGVELPVSAEHPREETVAAQTAWMAGRWPDWTASFILGDPELIGRWTPTAVRKRWAPLYGIPQADVIDRMSAAIGQRPLVYGRQHHDQDFVRLSRLGTGFQVIDPGSPPFPVVAERPHRWPRPPADPLEPSDEDLERWAAEGRVLSTVLFWTGMIREVQSIYALTDLLSLTRLPAGLVLTTESYSYMPHTPLTLVNVPHEAGGLFPRVELLLTDTGSGVLLAADAPPERFARTLKDSVAALGRTLGDSSLVPRGWWAHMDAPMLQRRAPRVTRYPDWPPLRLRYRPSNAELVAPVPWTGDGGRSRRSLRDRVRDSALREFFAPLRPYEDRWPGAPSRSVLEAVRDAGFEYALSKSAFGPVPRVVAGIDGLTVLNHTAGRWDGWSPFLTINSIEDLKAAERALVRRGRPGWLLGAFDTCLWAFTGPLWERGAELYAICRWLAAGGDSGRLVNVTPRTMARYAKLLDAGGRVERIQPG